MNWTEIFSHINPIVLLLGLFVIAIGYGMIAKLFGWSKPKNKKGPTK